MLLGHRHLLLKTARNALLKRPKQVNIQRFLLSTEANNSNFSNLEDFLKQQQQQQQQQPDTTNKVIKPAPIAAEDDENIQKLQQGNKFEADTAKLLDIVTNSLYTDKEVFLREIVSNAADALEKLRHARTSGGAASTLESEPLEIRISLDPDHNTLTIADTGIGMTVDEMKALLGTIGKSGSKSFVQNLKQTSPTSDSSSNIIGQFGVGFYSSFMVGKKVHVISRSALSSSPDVPAYVWTSSGTENYTIRPVTENDVVAKGLVHGTRIVIYLKDTAKEYATPDRVKQVINRYSNYVSFPIFLNDERVNTIEAVWTKSPTEVSEQSYKDFYKFVAKAFDDPMMHLHFRTDVPIDLKALLYVPSFHTEKTGMGRMQPGVSVYSRKVLLEANSEKILPGFLRFVKGVVDSDDLPLSISREAMQDSRLMTQMKTVVTKKLIKSWVEKAKKEPEEYLKFWKVYGHFLKEGVCTDYASQNDLAKLLRFNTSTIAEGEFSSLDEYISRCDASQNKIYYLSSPTRELALSSSYYEIFKGKKVEVLFLYQGIDDFVMSNLQQYNGRQLVSIEASEKELELEKITVPKSSEDSATNNDNNNNNTDDKNKKDAEPSLDASEAEGLKDWIAQELNAKVGKVILSTRLVGSPAVIVNHESASMKRMLKMLNQEESSGKVIEDNTKQELEINPKHPIIIELAKLRNTKPQLASLVAQQVFDNAMIGAGLYDDPRVILPRLTSLMEKLLLNKD